jgi:hypothetical protein
MPGPSLSHPRAPRRSVLRRSRYVRTLLCETSPQACTYKQSRFNSSQTPLIPQRPLQHSLSSVQGSQSCLQGAAQVPPSQLPLQHTLSFVQCFPLRLQPGGSAAASQMPSDASVPPTRAAPISLSALPREMLPLARPVASSSKERLEVSWLTRTPIPRRAGLGD